MAGGSHRQTAKKTAPLQEGSFSFIRKSLAASGKVALSCDHPTPHHHSTPQRSLKMAELLHAWGRMGSVLASRAHNGPRKD